MIRNLISCSAALVALSACANPVVAPRVQPQDHAKNCAALEQDMVQAGQLKVAARDEDKFQWKYIFVVNGFISAYRMNAAEKAAEERLTELELIAASKHCPVPQPMAFPDDAIPLTPASANPKRQLPDSSVPE